MSTGQHVAGRHASRKTLLVSCAFLLLALTGCATTAQRGPVFSATAIVHLNPAATPRVARRAAIHDAELLARQQLMNEAYSLRLSDGRALENLAILDPFVRAVIDDTVRRARISDQAESEEGVITLTLRMELDPLYSMIAQYPKHSI